MTMTEMEWRRYVRMLRALSETVGIKVKEYIEKNGVEDTKALIDYSYALVTEYGEGAAALSAQLYDVIAEHEGMFLPPADMADTAGYGDIAKTVNGTLKTSVNAEEISGAVSRWVKMAGADTTLKNAYRDGAQFAWIPSGDTCAFCIALAANGWQNVSKKSLRKGHAEHIHSNCDCQYAVRFNEDTKIGNYNPDDYMQKINAAAEEQGLIDKNSSVDYAFAGYGGQMNSEVINAMRRENYKINAEQIRKQKASAYERRKELESSAAEETKT